MQKIGIIMRPSTSESGLKIWVLYNSFVSILNSYNVMIIPINQNNLKKIIASINFCDKVILQGGDEITNYDMDIIDYLYKNNIPTLGVCLGMQLMGIYLGGTKIMVKNHKSKNKYVHNIIIKKNSLLYQIIKSDYILVNSRHYEALQIKDIYVGAYSKDLVVEEIEDKTRRFFIGVQWHPESLLEDNNTKLILTSFINS